MKNCVIILMLFAGATVSQCQTLDSRFLPAEERIETFFPDRRHFNVAGASHEGLYLEVTDSIDQTYLYFYNEMTRAISEVDLKINQNQSRILQLHRFQNFSFLIGYENIPAEYRKGRLEDLPIENFEYQLAWLQIGSRSIRADSLKYHYIDKYYKTKFSFDGEFVIINPYTTNSAGYFEEEDNFFALYDLRQIKAGKITKRKISCGACMNTFLVDEEAVYQKEIDVGGGFDGTFHNIYKAPINKINDTTLVAFDIELWELSSDGNFALGTKYLFGKSVPVIANLRSKRYQYILGRPYPIDNAFYSPTLKKFGFVIDNQLVYIETPSIFPFDALDRNKEFTTNEQDRQFWDTFNQRYIR